MDFTDLKEKGKRGEQKSKVTLTRKEGKVNSTAKYENISFIPDNKPTTKNEPSHEYEVLRETTQLPQEQTSKRSACEQLNCHLIYVILVIQVLLFLGIVAITVFLVISESKQTDGSWKNWESWGQCSVTCDYGMQSRNRTCSEQTSGKHCYGDATEYRICNNRFCHGKDQSTEEVNGGWSVWASWGKCSASCGTGMESRNRACSNPKPSKGGDFCSGDSTEYRLCNKFACPGTSIGFSVHNPVLGTGGNTSALKFRYSVENSAGAFNMTTGEFVCRQSGLYFFSTTVLRSTSITQPAYCYFYKNGVKHNYFAGYANDADLVYTSGTNVILYHLRPGDTVSLRNCENSNHFDPSTSFTGFLVHAD